MTMSATRMRSCRHASATSTHQTGIGLIEVLIALIVLSIGFLVSANMQLRGMKTNQETYFESQALMLANDMMDRMRSNRAGVLAGSYDDMTTGDVNKPSCASSGCDASGLAALDKYEWSAHLVNVDDDTDFIPVLPPGSDNVAAKGTVSSPDSDGVYTITLHWKSHENNSEVLKTFPVKFLP